MTMAEVLVVDDNEMNSKLLKLLLTSEGYEVATARDAAEALELAERLRPRLVFMDIQLPGMSGLEATRILRGRASTKHARIVAVTSYAMKGDRERALASGCDEYMAKPIDSKALLALANQMLPRGERRPKAR